jgi:hypothetical protein
MPDEVHVHVHVDLGAVMARIDSMDRRIKKLSRRMERMMPALDDKIVQLQTDVSEISTVVDSAIALIGGIAEQVRRAVEEALAAGATEAQLQAMTDLGASLDAKGAALAAAVAEHTQAEDEPEPTPEDGSTESV